MAEGNNEGIARSSSMVNSKQHMYGKDLTKEPINKNFSTPYEKMENEELDPYDDFSDSHNISIADAYEQQCDLRKTLIGGTLVLIMATIIFLVVWYKGFLMDQVSEFTDTIREYPFYSVLIFWVAMTICISASVPSAIPEVFGSYVFVQAFGFIKGFWIMVLVDYFSMLVGCIPPFLLARYLLKS